MFFNNLNRTSKAHHNRTPSAGDSQWFIILIEQQHAAVDDRTVSFAVTLAVGLAVGLAVALIVALVVSPAVFVAITRNSSRIVARGRAIDGCGGSRADCRGVCPG